MRAWIALPCCVALLSAAEQGAWKQKKIAEWSEDDAKTVLTDSPWAKTVTPKVDRPSGGRRGGMGGPRIGIGGIGGMGGPRMGGGRRGGYGGTGSGPSDRKPREMTVRWESAMPVQAAELKARETNAPEVDESHYAIAVVGVPLLLVNTETAKPKGELKCDGKKKIKLSSFRILQHDDNTATVIFLFPRSQEVAGKVKELDFDAHIGPMQLAQAFTTSEMVYDGKLEL